MERRKISTQQGRLPWQCERCGGRERFRPWGRPAKCAKCFAHERRLPGRKGERRDQDRDESGRFA
jgi:hypothetical protein